MKNILFVIFSFLFFLSCSNDDVNGPPVAPPSESSENKIISFELVFESELYSGIIDHDTGEIYFETTGFENSPDIIPNIEISDQASISPSPTVAQDFNSDVTYTVTAENGDTANYTVIIENTPLSNESKILNFEIHLEGEIIIGEIDHETLTITTPMTNKDISNIVPEIEISENASIYPGLDESQDFRFLPVEYTVTAEDGSTSIYKVKVPYLRLSSSITTCYVNTKAMGSVTYLDIINQDYKLYIENETHSYEVEWSDFDQHVNLSGTPYTRFNFEFNEDIETATDYKMVLRLNGEIKVVSEDDLDILKEDAPKISSANQTNYYYGDTLILTGENLKPGLRIPANMNIYQYDDQYVSINSDASTLIFPLTVNQNMFPSWVGQDSPRETRIYIFYQGRYGDSIIVNFN